MAGEDGNQYVWGYVPVIVAKVGLYLKEKGEWGSQCCRSYATYADHSVPVHSKSPFARGC